MTTKTTSYERPLGYICAECGAFAAEADCDSIDSGTTLQCEKCGKNTIVLLMKHDEYCAAATLKQKAAIFDWCVNHLNRLVVVDEISGGNDNVGIKASDGTWYRARTFESAVKAAMEKVK